MATTNLTRIDPFSVHGFDPFEDVLQGFFRPVLQKDATQPQLKMDVEEDDNVYNVRAEMPGVNKEDIQINIDGSHVSISAEVKREKEVKDGSRVLRSERYYGKVSRSFVLENEIDDSKAEAHYKDGVLELVLPKKASSAAKKLTVN